MALVLVEDTSRFLEGGRNVVPRRDESSFMYAEGVSPT